MNIHYVSINGHIHRGVDGWANIFIHRTDNQGRTFVNYYKIRNLTRYQRAVRLLNAFVGRNMK